MGDKETADIKVDRWNNTKEWLQRTLDISFARFAVDICGKSFGYHSRYDSPSLKENKVGSRIW